MMTSLGAGAAAAWADAPATGGNQPVTLEEVVVTAEKRTSNIQDVTHVLGRNTNRLSR